MFTLIRKCGDLSPVYVVNIGDQYFTTDLEWKTLRQIWNQKIFIGIYFPSYEVAQRSLERWIKTHEEEWANMVCEVLTQ